MDKKTNTHPVGATWQSAVPVLVLLYLLVPNVLFLAGWVQPWLAIPLSAMLVAGAFPIWKKRRMPPPYPDYTRGDYAKLILALIVDLWAVELISFHGHIPQEADFFVRNPIYQTLIREPWPIYSDRGEYFIYYFSFWLPPAFLSKHITFASADTILFFWAWAGLALATLVAFLRLKGKVLPFVIIFIALGHIGHCFYCLLPGPWVEYQAHNGVFQNFWLTIQPVHAYVSSYAYPAGIVQLCQTFHHAIPVFLIFCTLFSGIFAKESAAYVSATGVLASPLGSVALLMWLLIKQAPFYCSKSGLKSQLKDSSLYAALPLVVVAGVFFTLNDTESSSLVGSLRQKGLADAVVSYTKILFLAGCVLIPACLFLGRRYMLHTSYGLASIVICLALPHIIVGLINNELQLKGAIIMYGCLALLFSARWAHSRKKWRVFFAVFLFLSSGELIERLVCDVPKMTWNPEKMQENKWGLLISPPFFPPRARARAKRLAFRLLFV